MGTCLQVKVCEWRQKDTSDVCVSVGKRLVEKCVLDADKDNEKRDRQLEHPQHLCDTGCQKRRRGCDGTMVEKTPTEFDTLHSKVVISHCQTWLRGPIHRWGGHVARLPTNHWLAEAVRARAVQCSGQEFTRSDTRSSVGRTSWAVGTAKGARRTPEWDTGWWKDAQDRESRRKAE